MKIAIIIYSLNHGGAEKQAVSDANCLQERGHDITLIYNRPGELLESLGNEIEVVRIHSGIQLLASFFLLLYLIHNRFDILHAHMFWAEKITAIPAFLTRHKLIFNEHGLGKWRRWYHRLLMRFVSLFADKIICSCQLNCRLRHEMEHIAWPKLQTIYNGFVSQQESTVTNKKVTADTDFVIGFVGRFHEVKRIGTFIELASKLHSSIPSVKFILVGDGPEFEEFNKNIQENGLDDYFELPGFQSQTSIFYQKFDVFVLPSRIEGFSISLLEAGSYGLPTLAYDVGGNSEIVENGKTGYIIPDGDVSALTDAIYFLYRHPGKLAELGDNARNKIFGRFSLEKRMNELEALYQSL